MNSPNMVGLNGNTPNDAAINNANASIASQKALIAAVGGTKRSAMPTRRKRQLRSQSRRRSRSKFSRSKTKRRRHLNGGAGTLIVPTVPTAYTPAGGGDQTPDNITTTLAQISTQGEANAQYDSMATGGRRRLARQRKRKTKRAQPRRHRHTRIGRGMRRCSCGKSLKRRRKTRRQRL